MSNPEHEISKARQEALRLARSFGWETHRKSPKCWEFRQADTGGLWDVFRISHSNLSVSAVLCALESYEIDLASEVSEARKTAQMAWLKKRRPTFQCEDRDNDN